MRYVIHYYACCLLTLLMVATLPLKSHAVVPVVDLDAIVQLTAMNTNILANTTANTTAITGQTTALSSAISTAITGQTTALTTQLQKRDAAQLIVEASTFLLRAGLEIAIAVTTAVTLISAAEAARDSVEDAEPVSLTNFTLPEFKEGGFAK